MIRIKISESRKLDVSPNFFENLKAICTKTGLIETEIIHVPCPPCLAAIKSKIEEALFF